VRQLIAFLFFTSLPGLARAQAQEVKPVEIRRHYIGESAGRFLRLEADAREEVEVCRQHNGSVCDRLLAAIDQGQRAEISTLAPLDIDSPDAAKETIDFVLDGGKLVKITMLVNGAPEVIQIFGQPSIETVIPSENGSGTKWENHLFVWDRPDAYVSLFEDNNPSLQDRHPVLIVESRAEHARELESEKRTKAPDS
jgi:hypothetical protein